MATTRETKSTETNQDVIVVFVKLTEFEQVEFGKSIGYGQIDSTNGDAQIGEGAIITSGPAGMMRQADYRIGSIVCVRVKPNSDSRTKKDYPWAAVYWEKSHVANVSIAHTNGLTQKQTEVLERARKVLQRFKSMGELASNDAVAFKAAQDVVAAVKDYSVNAVLSACGRVTARLDELERHIQLVGREAAARDAFLDEFADLV